MAARAVQGAGGAIVVTLSLTLLVTCAAGAARGGDRRPERIQRPRHRGRTGARRVVVQSLHWTWIFWLNVPVGLAAVVFASTLLAESHGPPVRWRV
jgi:hypothetical protein